MNSVSVTGKKWILKKFSYSDVLSFKENFSLDEITSKLLVLRNIKSQDIKTYLSPTIKNMLPNPNSIIDMEKGVERTIRSILLNEKIGIFGDYDVDGASATAILGKYFKEIKNEVEIYIPDRKKEGYGPSINGFDKLILKQVKLIFTVDCGTLSFEPISYAKSKKIDVLVLDHHQSEIKLPEAYSVINPNRLDDNSKLNYLCASGVCFMFLVALNTELRKLNWFEKNKISEPNLLDFLDLVSLGTVCDVVPLIGLNRAIVKQGLKVLKSKKNLGLKTLLEICNIQTIPSTYHLGYILGPRINAGGRVGKCSHGANLLLNISAKDSFKLATELNDFNKQRQLLEKDLLNKVLKDVNNNINDPVLILYGKNWHEGIIGIIAARIKDKFNKPTIIISINQEIGKASARSIVGFDIGEVIISAAQRKLIIKGGGHKMAGGFSINIRNLDSFKEFVFNRFNKMYKNGDAGRSLYIDSVIAPSALNIDFFDKINYLSPFGSGNPEPKFVIENVKSVTSQIVGDKHVKSILICKDGSSINTIAFNAKDTELASYLLTKNHKTFNIAGKLSLNEWKGKKNVEFIIDDISVIKNLKNTVPSSIG